MLTNMRHNLCFLFIAGITLSSCSLDVKYENQFSDPYAITNVAVARELLASAYNELPNPEFDLSILADDFTTTYWTKSNPSILNQYNWQPSALQSLSSYWNAYYSVVASVNTLLERLPSVETSDSRDVHEKEYVRAEALTLKAFCYFNLLRLFAPDYSDGPESDGVIIKDKVEMETLARKSIRDCCDEIRRLLKEALSLNPTEDNDSWLDADASLYLLADLELFCGNFSEAITASEALISEIGLDALEESEYSRLWELSDNKEQIFCFDNPQQSDSFYLSIVYDKDNGDYFAISPDLANSFSSTDIRYNQSVYETESPSLGAMKYFGKYNKLRKQGLNVTKIHKLRLSGVYFIMAESLCALGEYSKAREVINKYLNARKADTIPDSLPDTSLTETILTEKQKEFVGEGQRFFDLKRYRKTILRNWINGQPAERRIMPGDYRWTLPIPKEEYLYNENVTQNKGWELS